jgi:16S rRNA (uracil1498-N3)-methyltransferase
MAAAYFYIPQADTGAAVLTLDEANARHAVQVLRMKTGDELHLSDGNGRVFLAEILETGRRNCTVRIKSTRFIAADSPKISIGLSLLKNNSRFEWFLEKVTELGVQEVFPLLCSRTEKQQFRMPRMLGILESALVQSQQAWIPVLHEPLAPGKLLERTDFDQRWIAHCGPGEKTPLGNLKPGADSSILILIGPEGDFTENEIAAAIEHQCRAISLGNHRLRSETAAVAAVSALKL